RRHAPLRQRRGRHQQPARRAAGRGAAREAATPGRLDARAAGASARLRQAARGHARRRAAARAGLGALGLAPLHAARGTPRRPAGAPAVARDRDFGPLPAADPPAAGDGRGRRQSGRPAGLGAAVARGTAGAALPGAAARDARADRRGDPGLLLRGLAPAATAAAQGPATSNTNTTRSPARPRSRNTTASVVSWIASPATTRSEPGASRSADRSKRQAPPARRPSLA